MGLFLVMNQRQKGVIAIGVVAGLAAVLGTAVYLRTESGKRFLKEASKRLPSGRGSKK